MKSKLILSIDDFSKKFIVSESQVAILEDFDIYIENLPTSTNDTQYTIEEVSIEILDFNKTSIFSVKTAGEFTEEGYCIEGLKINSTKAVKAFRLSPRTQRMVMTLWITYAVQTINGDASEASVETINTYYGNAFVKIHNAPTTDGMEVHEAVTQIEQHDADPNAHAALFKGVEDGIEALHETISSEVAARILQEETNRNNAINLAIKEQGLDTIKSLVDGAATSASAAAISAEAAGKTLDEVSALAVDTKEYKEAAEGFKEESEQILEDVTSKKIDIDAKVSQFNSTYAEATTNIENFENTSAQANREIEELKSNALTALDEKETATTLVVSLAGAQQVALVEQKAEDEASNLESLATTLKEEIEGSTSGFDAKVEAAIVDVNNTSTTAITKVVNAQTTAEGAIEDAKEEALKEIEEAGGSAITVDKEISSESTNPVQNKVIKTALDDKADQIIFPCGVSIGSDEVKGGTSDGSQINIGQGSLAWGSNSIAIGHNAEARAPVNIVIGKDSRTVVGSSGNSTTRGVIVGIENRVENVDGIAIGAGHILTEEGEIAIGAGDNMAGGYVASETAKANTIRVKGGVLTVGGKEISGGGGSSNTEVWNGTIDSIDKVYDDMIGAKKLSNGNYPRLHARNKEIHGCKGFSNETGDYTGQELLLPWEVAMTNESSYLMAAVKFQANRGFGTQTFVQPLVPKETGAASAYFPYALPAFEDSPVYWKGHFIYSNARQMFLPWDKISTGGSGTLALTSDIPDTSGFLANSGTEAAPKLSGDTGVEITTKGANGIAIYSTLGGKMNGFVLRSIGLMCFIDGVPQTNILSLKTVYDSLKYGATANNNCCFTPKSNADDSLAFTISRYKTLYTANIVTDALETTLSMSAADGVIADGEACVVWVKIKIASTLATAPVITVPNTIQFMGDEPSFGIGTECMLALMSTDQGATWVANVQWEKDANGDIL